jgi:hypothetical protein
LRQYGVSTISGEEFLALGKAIEKKAGPKTEKPAIVKLLPSENMVPRSVVLARGRLAIDNQAYIAEEDLFGLGEGEVAVIAQYGAGWPKFPVIIAEYASSEACEEALQRFRTRFSEGITTEGENFIFTRSLKAFHGARRIGTRLIVVVNAEGRKGALSMLDSVSEHMKAQ